MLILILEFQFVPEPDASVSASLASDSIGHTKILYRTWDQKYFSGANQWLIKSNSGRELETSRTTSWRAPEGQSRSWRSDRCLQSCSEISLTYYQRDGDRDQFLLWHTENYLSPAVRQSARPKYFLSSPWGLWWHNKLPEANLSALHGPVTGPAGSTEALL